ncbi:hypothetical protein KEJ39_09775 [Candidatus Bathyarchaeota archaeon]|nr:hypothetical protein [Candidatus Bathyarchaeota archaeon]
MAKGWKWHGKRRYHHGGTRIRPDGSHYWGGKESFLDRYGDAARIEGSTSFNRSMVGL